MNQLVSLPLPGTLGNVAGPGSDGVHVGVLTFADPTKVLLKSLSEASPLCITDDGGTYVDESTPFNEDTADDVEVLPATPAVDDAAYFGVAASTFQQVDLNITTQGAGTWTITWEYWNGSAWTALSGVTDGTTGFTAATGIKSVSFTEPSDWGKCLVDGQYAYWIRARVSAYTSVTTPPQVGQGWIIDSDGAWTDDTTDATDVGAGDVDLLPAYSVVGDGLYVGYSEKFCKIKVTTSQARTGTATLTLKYWDGDSWESVDTVEDDSVGYSATAGTHIVHFVPPSDWAKNTVANGPNGQAGYFVAIELTAKTSVTQQPLGTQMWVFPLKTGASGVPVPGGGSIADVRGQAQTPSAENADSVFLLVNVTRGTFATLTWTQADAFESWTATLVVEKDDELVVVQITEDGTTEFADASLFATLES